MWKKNSAKSHTMFKGYVRRRTPHHSDDQIAETSQCLELHDAIVRNIPEAVLQLVTQGTDVNAGLHFEANSYNLDRTLISRDIITLPLHVACIYRRPKIVEVLLSCGANCNAKDHYGRTPIQLVIHYWPRLMYSLEKKEMTKADIEYQEYLKAQHEKCHTSLESLCTAGANVDGVVNVEGETVLHLAAKFNIWRSVPLLTAYGPRTLIERRDRLGNTPLLTAAKYGRFEVLFELIKKGGRIREVEFTGKTILHLCASSDTSAQATNIHSLLIDEGIIDILNKQDEKGETALHVAARCGREAVIHVLLQQGANADILNNQEVSALYLLLDDIDFRHYVYTIEKLISETVQISILSSSNALPVLLREQENLTMKEYLVNASMAPSSLQFICRQTVRHCLGIWRVNTATVDILEIPKKIKNYILLNTVKISL